MLVIPDVQDVYTPLQTDVVVQLSEVSLNCEIFSFCGSAKKLISSTSI
jgi:hypothetical protein